MSELLDEMERFIKEANENTWRRSDYIETFDNNMMNLLTLIELERANRKI